MIPVGILVSNYLKMEESLPGTPRFRVLKMEAHKEQETCLWSSASYREVGSCRVPCERGGQRDLCVLGVTL